MKGFFHLAFFLLLACLGSLGDPPTDQQLISSYFIEKYGEGNETLSWAQIDTIIRNSRSCSGEKPHDLDNDCQGQKTQSLECEELKKRKALCKFPSNGQGDFHSLCQTILYKIENSECFLKEETNTDTGDTQRKKPTTGEVWGYGILCVTVISFSSLAGVSLMPFMAKTFYKHLLTTMVGLAVGSLTGSALFHLLPQAYGLADDQHHSYLFISLMTCGGIWLFFMVERILKFTMDYKERKEKARKGGHHGIFTNTSENSTISMLVEAKSLPSAESPSSSLEPTTPCNPQPNADVIYESQEQAIKASFGHKERPRSSHEHFVKFEDGKDSVIATVAWMIIFGDGLHNFIDGLSIGAAFNESILTGVSISLAVLCEELPHELGDFAVLLNAGMSMKQAITYNFLSACTCYLGLALGIQLGKIEASVYIFALAGGMFLYIALVDMVPEMNEIAEETSKISVGRGMKVLFLQNVGLFIGISSLFILARFQQNIQIS